MRMGRKAVSMDNKGLSLVEIVIVVTIMTVLTGIMAVGVSLALSKPADECAEKIVSTLSNARITTMGKQGITLKFYEESDQSIWLEEVITNPNGTISSRKSKIGQKGVVVTYKLDGDTHKNLGSDGIALSFKRSTGGFNTAESPLGTDKGKYCEEIVVSKGNRTKTITLYYLTGKVTIQ